MLVIVIIYCTTVWCLATLSTMVCSEFSNPFPAKPFYRSHRLDLVMIQPPVIDNGAFVVSPESVWYALVLLLFSATSQTDIGFKALIVSSCRRCKYMKILIIVIIVIIDIFDLLLL
jgi:hypothetical protein